MLDKIKKFGPYVLLAAVVGTLIVLNCVCQTNWLDSDMAAEMRFSKLLTEEGRWLATPNWYYSTEFRVLYTQLIMAPLLKVCGSWYVVRAVTNILSYALVLGSYYYFMKPLKVRKGLVITTSAILLLPFSETMMTHMVMGNTYMFHVIIVFLFFGLYLRLVQGNRGKLFFAELAFFLLLATVCGVSGVRYLLALQCPLLLTALVYLLKSESGKAFRVEVTDENLVAKFRALLKENSMRYFGYASLGLAGSVLGYGFNVLYVSKEYVFQTYGATNFIAVYQGIFFERLQNALGSLLMLFGYIPDKGFLSLRGIVTLAAFGMIGVFAFVYVRGHKRLDKERSFVSLFLGISFLLNVFVFVFTTSTMVPRYYLTIFIFALPVLCFYMESEKLFFDKSVVTLLLIGCFTLATAKTVLSFVTVDKNAGKRAVAEFLESNGYEFGYATYWNANIITELTDGRVEIAHVGDPKGLEYFRWSSPMKYYEEDYKAGEVFLLVTEEERGEWANCKALQTGEKVYGDNYYSVYVFDSIAELKACREAE